MSSFLHIDMGDGAYITSNGTYVTIPRIGETIYAKETNSRRRVTNVIYQYKEDGTIQINVLTEASL